MFRGLSEDVTSFVKTRRKSPILYSIPTINIDAKNTSNSCV